MSFDLFPYQQQAAEECLDRIEQMRQAAALGRRSSVGLSSLTGSGKTMIATAVIEATIFGSSDLGVDPDPRACFLWVTDDPSLNKQTLDKMYAASELLRQNRLHTIEPTFMDELLSPGNVYFLNVQKLYAGNSLTKTGSDKRRYSMWDILRHTIEHDSIDLYLVLDEAHKGMKSEKARTTTVQKIIDGQKGMNPPVPAVWGISATIENFTTAMNELARRNQLEPVEVDVEMVRASGLVKDAIGIEQPNEGGKFSSTLLREAVKAALDYDRRWQDYAENEDAELVEPVLVVQVPDKASASKIAELVTSIEAEWKGLAPDAIAHVFGEHEPIVLSSGRVIEWVPPQSIQGETHIRVVLAKTAISTGWDCPRAEVLYSERPAKDATHIAQIIGRMVRQPLARRIDTDSALNTVACYLPLFNQKTLSGIIAELEGRGRADSLAPSVLSEPEVFGRNPEVDDEVFDFVNTLVALPAPAGFTSPIKRARTLALLLADPRGGEALEAGAPDDLTETLNYELAGLAAKHQKAVKKQFDDLNDMDSSRTEVATLGGEASVPTFRSYARHISEIERDVRLIVRSVKEGAGQDYYQHRVDEAGDESDLLTIKTEVAALFEVDGVLESLDNAATEWVHSKLSDHDVSIKHTKGKVAAAYQRVRDMAVKPEQSTVKLGENLKTATKSSAGEMLETFGKHLFADEHGQFPMKFDSSWEAKVLTTEIQRETTVAWYRNPSRPTGSALRIAYQRGDGKWTSLQPDFVIISKLQDGTLVAAIVDPHGHHLPDARDKLVALADYVESHGGQFVRVESIAKVDGDYRKLDLTREEVRQAIRGSQSDEVKALYQSGSASDY